MSQLYQDQLNRNIKSWWIDTIQVCFNFLCSGWNTITQQKKITDFNAAINSKFVPNCQHFKLLHFKLLLFDFTVYLKKVKIYRYNQRFLSYGRLSTKSWKISKTLIPQTKLLVAWSISALFCSGFSQNKTNK